MIIRSRRLAAFAVTALLGAAAIGWSLKDVGQGRQREAGAALYHGEQALTGRIVGHDLDLPAQASRCINCHGGAAAASAPSLAPLLNAASLTSLTPRRGGPPSRYDRASLCGLLRSGVDPAHVMIPRTMPRYTLTDTDCEALWAYLNTR